MNNINKILSIKDINKIILSFTKKKNVKNVILNKNIYI